LAVGTSFSGHYHSEEVDIIEVKLRVNVWTVQWDQKGGHCREVALSEGSITV